LDLKNLKIKTLCTLHMYGMRFSTQKSRFKTLKNHAVFTVPKKSINMKINKKVFKSKINNLKNLYTIYNIINLFFLFIY
jgi:hypothetical protein